MVQGTKVNLCKFERTKKGITSFVMPNNKYLVPIVDLILTLIWDPLDEPIFLHILKLGLVTWITALNLQYHMSTLLELVIPLQQTAQ